MACSFMISTHVASPLSKSQPMPWLRNYNGISWGNFTTYLVVCLLLNIFNILPYHPAKVTPCSCKYAKESKNRSGTTTTKRPACDFYNLYSSWGVRLNRCGRAHQREICTHYYAILCKTDENRSRAPEAKSNVLHALLCKTEQNRRGTQEAKSLLTCAVLPQDIPGTFY